MFIDLSASTQSTSGVGQLKALQQLDISVQLDKKIAGSANYTFEIGSTACIRSVILDTPIALIIFDIMLVNTLYLLCLANMDNLQEFFNNITNQVKQTQPPRSHPVIWRYSYAFLLWYTSTYTLVIESLALNLYYLTDIELRHLYCHFGHPSVH